MPSNSEIEAKFWKALRDDMTLMLGLDGEGEVQPMTALLDGDVRRGPIWFFASADSEFVQSLAGAHRGVAHFASKNHGLFSTIHGELALDFDRAVVDRLWNKWTAAWFEGGKDDPKLRLIRFDPEHAVIWLNENSLAAGVKTLFGVDPKKDYQDKVAEVRLS
jgi:general stress protein 26